MRKTSVIILVLFLCSVLLVNSRTKVVEAQTRTIVVPDDYQTIQEAIDNANEGDTVFVRSGSYDGNLIVNNSISMLGESKDSTFIIGNQTGTTVLIQKNYVKVINFTIQSPQTPLLWDRKKGIHLLHANNCVVSENNILRNDLGIGIWLYGSSNNVITGNMVKQASEGVYLDLSTNNTLTGNAIEEVSYGIRLHESSNNIFKANNISGNNFEVYFGYDGEYVTHIANNSFYHNNFFNNGVPVGTLGAVIGLNSWDDGKEGNYWMGYQGEDDNGDGIGDSPYLVYENYFNGNHTDNYPLINQVDIKVIPEFSSWIILPLFIFSTIAVFYAKKKLIRRS